MTASLRSIGTRVATLDASAAKPPPKTADAFYLSREWRALIAEIIAERGARCEDQRHDPRRPRGGVRVFGDHVHELQDGGAPLDKANVLLRCGSCHARKTVAVRAARMAERVAPRAGVPERSRG
ncbi:MAG: HNH endonuclease [Reyranellaceae bacterium]